jgi:hypothetical protein
MVLGKGHIIAGVVCVVLGIMIYNLVKGFLPAPANTAV